MTPKRPDTAIVNFPVNDKGTLVRSEGPIEWLCRRVGYADVPSVVVGSKVRCLCVWDGARSHVLPVPFGTPLANVMDAILGTCADMAAMGSHFDERLRRLEGKAAGDTAEELANAPPAPILPGPGPAP